LNALSEAILRLLHKQEDFDRRLAALEAGVRYQAPARAMPTPSPLPFISEPIITPEPATPPLLPATETPPEIPATPPPVEPRRLETNIGLTWLNRIGVITLVLGVAFFFKWAADNQYIGPAGRVELGVLAGLAALAAADYLWRKGQRIFAQGVTGAGVAIVYLSVFAAFSFYQLIPQSFAFVFMFVATLSTAALALRYASVAIAALGLFGGYLTPILLSTGEDHPWFLFSYVLLLDVGALALARKQAWKLLEILSLFATVTLFWAWMASHYNSDKRLVAVVFKLVFYAVFSVTSLRWLFIIAQASAALALAIVTEKEALQFFALELSIVAAGLWISGWKKSNALWSVTFASFWIVYGLWSIDFYARPPLPMFEGITAAFLLFLGWVAWLLLVGSHTLSVQQMTVFALNGAAYFGCSYALLEPKYHAWLGLLAVAVAGAHLALGAHMWRVREAKGVDTRPVLLSLGISLCFLTLAIPIQLTQYRITMAWSLEGAALAWIGARLRSDRALYGALLVFALVYARLLSIDSWIFPTAASYATLWNGRFLTFAVAAVSLLCAAWWARETPLVALPEYLAGHIALLWGLSLEAIGWAERTSPPQNQLSVETVSISILFAIYAVALVSLGVVTRAAINRICGLTLIGLVVLKLYFFDVWQLGRGYRISAFVALGALLLTTSFLYSRFRATIEKLWKDDAAHP